MYEWLSALCCPAEVPTNFERPQALPWTEAEPPCP